MKLDIHSSGIKFSNFKVFNGSSQDDPGIQWTITEEELQQAFEELHKYDGSITSPIKKECQHDWETYEGLYTKDRSCKKCNTREEL
jgi:hypothetical protein